MHSLALACTVRQHTQFIRPIQTLKNSATKRGSRVLPPTNFIWKLNEEYLRLLSKVYESRYYDKLPEGYNYVILGNKCLVELDYTFPLLDSQVMIHRVNTPDAELTPAQMEKLTLYAQDQNNKTPLLCDNNFFLLGIDRSELVNYPELVIEMRLQKSKVMMQAVYTLKNGPNASRFSYEGLKPVDDIGKQFHTAFPADGAIPTGELRLRRGF